MKVEDINLRSDEVNEIFAKIPSHLVRWGNTWILIVLIGLLTLAYFVKYPDVITGNAMLLSSNTPVNLVAQNNGKIHLLASNLSAVTTHSRIAYIGDDGANIDDMDSLYSLLKQSDVDSLKIEKNKLYSLGKLQNSWGRFVVDLESYQNYLKANPEQIGIANSGKQIQNNQLSEANLREQIGLKESQLNFYINKLEKEKSLLQRGMISEREVQNTYSQVIEMENQLKVLSSQQIGINRNNSDYQKQISELQATKFQSQNQKLTSLKQARISLIEEMEVWYKMNCFVAPFDGTVQYNLPIVDEQFITQATEIFTITPHQKNEIMCQVLIPMAGMGKVTLGQKVIVRLQHYPEEEFGILKGKIKAISPTANKEKNYIVNVSLDQGMKTSYGKEVAYQPNMEGTADIVTKDKSFLHRIFEQLLKLVKRN
jgi:multidrug efflux pump subunit AcrA (membrane-fusion protein)